MAKLNAETFKVFYLNVSAFFAFSNGGDSIGTYNSLLPTLGMEQLKYGRWIVPIVFLGSGIYSVSENGTFGNMM